MRFTAEKNAARMGMCAGRKNGGAWGECMEYQTRWKIYGSLG